MPDERISPRVIFYGRQVRIGIPYDSADGPGGKPLQVAAVRPSSFFMALRSGVTPSPDGVQFEPVAVRLFDVEH